VDSIFGISTLFLPDETLSVRIGIKCNCKVRDRSRGSAASFNFMPPPPESEHTHPDLLLVKKTVTFIYVDIKAIIFILNILFAILTDAYLKRH